MKELDIRPADLSRLVKTLSGGNHKSDPGKMVADGSQFLLILDEPTGVLTLPPKPSSTRSWASWLIKVYPCQMISSELPRSRMSERVLVMRHGAIVHQFNRQEATEERLLDYAAGVEK